MCNVCVCVRECICVCECVYACAEYMCARVCVHMCVSVSVCVTPCVCVCILEVTKCTFDLILNWQVVDQSAVKPKTKPAYRNPKRKLKESVMK